MKNKCKDFRKSNEEAGITLVALVVTIVILLILAGISMAMVLGDNGLIQKAKKTAFLTEVTSIDEQVKLSQSLLKNEYLFGTINEILDTENKYNAKFEVQKGELKYTTNVSEQEKAWLKEINIEPAGKYYLVMTQQRFEKEFKDRENAGTIEMFRDLVNTGEFAQKYDEAYLIEDIDLKDICSETIGDWVPIGTSSNYFTKIFDGCNYKISNLYISNTEDYQGLFGYVGNNGSDEKAEIKNLTINGTINALYSAGGIIGAAQYGTLKIENCHNMVNITKSTSGLSLGGIIGDLVVADVEILNTTNIGNISGSNNAGGIVGWMYGILTMDNCNNQGMVLNSTGNYAGGLLGNLYTYGVEGETSTVTIKNSYNCGEIQNVRSADNTCAGGLIGISYGGVIAENCYNSGNVTGKSRTGGIIGASAQGGNVIINNVYNAGSIEQQGSVNSNKYAYASGIIGICYKSTNNIYNSYNLGAITTGDWAAGGIVGESNASELTIVNSYNIGKIEGKAIASGVIGFVAAQDSKANIINTYNCGEISGEKNRAGIAYFCGDGKTGKEIKVQDVYAVNNQENIEGIAGKSADDVSYGEVQKVEPEDFKNNTLTNILNQGIEKIPSETIQDYKMNEWKTEGYPVHKL